MFTQPSVNQIASTYQGNPAPLARKVDQDKKQNGGIPQDLRQLLALNDITEGRNAMGIQQALQIPTNMPTVAQDLQERARQALQAKAMQQAQEMQRKNGMPNMVPPGTPRPPMQPQGLDSLRTNVGEAYAGGGIVGFDGTGSSQFVQDIASLPQAFDDLKQRVREEDAIKAAQDRRMAQRKQEALEARQKTSFFNYLFGSPERQKEGEAKLTEISSTPLNAPEKPPAVQATPLANIRGQLNTADAGVRAQPGTPPPPAPPKVNSVAQNRVNAPEAPGITSALPPAQTEAYKKLTEMMNVDRDAKDREFKERYEREVGKRDLSIYDQMAQELKARKERLNAPKAGYDATMEYLEQIALGGGRTSAEAGARGAARQRQLQADRLSQQDALMEKILDLGAKKSEAQFAEKKGMFEMTQRERDEIFKKAFDAAKSVNSSDDEAKRIAAQAVENEKNRQNQIRTAQIGAQDRDQLMNRAKALMAVDKTLTLEQAMTRASLAANASSVLSTESKDKAKGLEELRKLGADIPVAVRTGNSTFAKENRKQYEAGVAALEAKYGPLTSGLNALPGASSSGTVPPPPGFRVN